jgi:hypothetical protein
LTLHWNNSLCDRQYKEHWSPRQLRGEKRVGWEKLEKGMERGQRVRWGRERERVRDRQTESDREGEIMAKIGRNPERKKDRWKDRRRRDSEREIR